MANRRYQQFFNTLHNYPVLIDCNFSVLSTDPSGISGLKGPGVANVFMHTSTTPTTGSPNPAAGEIIVKLQDNYNFKYDHSAEFTSPNGAATTSSKANVINIITVLGTATTAQWVAVGLPIGVTPAVGVAFVGTTAAVIGGSAQTAIALAAGSGIDHIELAGNSNLSISNAGARNVLAGAGSLFYMRCLKNTVLTAPTDGTLISLKFYLSNTRILSASE